MQYLASIRMLFDYLVVGQIVPINPAAAVRGPKHVVKKGKTPVLYEDEAKELLGAVDTTTLIGCTATVKIPHERQLFFPISEACRAGRFSGLLLRC